eukprot:SAG22_NODE_961_length_6285_cov_20.669091_2_plen_674_part_00
MADADAAAGGGDALANGTTAGGEDDDLNGSMASRYRVPLLKHHSRRGLSVPLELRGVSGVQLADSVVLDSPKVSSKDHVAGLDTIHVELTISCGDLPRLEMTAACMRVFAVLFIWQPQKNNWVEYGRTETVQHGTNPTFTHSFILELLQKDDSPAAVKAAGHMITEATRSKVHVYHKATSKPTLKGQHLLGAHEFSLADLYNVPGRCMKSKLFEDGQSLSDATASVTVRLTPIVVDAWRVTAAVSGLGFRRPGMQEGNIDKATLPDLFFTLLRGNEGEDITDVEVCYRSEVVWQSDVPKWKPIEMSLHRLCAGLLDNTLKLEVWDWNRNGDHELIGSIHTTTRHLVEHKSAILEGLTLQPDVSETADGGTVTSKPYGAVQFTGDLHKEVAVEQPAQDTDVDTVYYVDVGDAAQVEDQRFLARLMADRRVATTNTREVVDAGMRAVAQRQYFMQEFLANRQAVQAMAQATRRSSLGDFNSFLSASEGQSPTGDIDSVGAAVDSLAAGDGGRGGAEGDSMLPPLGAQASLPDLEGPPAMVGRPSKMRHSFVPNYSTTSSNLRRQSGAGAGGGGGGGSSTSMNNSHASSAHSLRSRSVSPVRQTHASLLKVGLSAKQCQRMSPKYERLPARMRNRPPPNSRQQDGKLFELLFPRKRYAEMHGMPDDVSMLLRDIRS